MSYGREYRVRSVYQRTIDFCLLRMRTKYEPVLSFISTVLVHQEGGPRGFCLKGYKASSGLQTPPTIKMMKSRIKYDIYLTLPSKISAFTKLF